MYLCSKNTSSLQKLYSKTLSFSPLSSYFLVLLEGCHSYTFLSDFLSMIIRLWMQIFCSVANLCFISLFIHMIKEKSPFHPQGFLASPPPPKKYSPPRHRPSFRHFKMSLVSHLIRLDLLLFLSAAPPLPKHPEECFLRLMRTNPIKMSSIMKKSSLYHICKQRDMYRLP